LPLLGSGSRSALTPRQHDTTTAHGSKPWRHNADAAHFDQSGKRVAGRTSKAPPAANRCTRSSPTSLANGN